MKNTSELEEEYIELLLEKDQTYKGVVNDGQFNRAKPRLNEILPETSGFKQVCEEEAARYEQEAIVLMRSTEEQEVFCVEETTDKW